MGILKSWYLALVNYDKLLKWVTNMHVLLGGVNFLALLCLHLFEDILVYRVNFKEESILLN
jgi:hypothetical protein